MRDNQLVGYVLVVGLNCTGGKLDNAVCNRDALVGMQERPGVNTRDQITRLEIKNIAAVMVTGELPPSPAAAAGSMSRCRRWVMRQT